MPEPSMGQPYNATGLRVSVGDLGANYGTDASRGVIIIESGAPSPYIISPPAAFRIQAQVRIAFPGWDIALPGNTITEFHIVDLFTGVDAVPPIIVDAASTPPVEITPHPAGALTDPGDNVHWFAIETPSIAALPVGNYRITIFGSGTSFAGTSMLFIHDDTVLMVQ